MKKVLSGLLFAFMVLFATNNIAWPDSTTETIIINNKEKNDFLKLLAKNLENEQKYQTLKKNSAPSGSDRLKKDMEMIKKVFPDLKIPLKPKNYKAKKIPVIPKKKGEIETLKLNRGNKTVTINIHGNKEKKVLMDLFGEEQFLRGKIDLADLEGLEFRINYFFSGSKMLKQTSDITIQIDADYFPFDFLMYQSLDMEKPWQSYAFMDKTINSFLKTLNLRKRYSTKLRSFELDGKRIKVKPTGLITDINDYCLLEYSIADNQNKFFLRFAVANNKTLSSEYFLIGKLVADKINWKEHKLGLKSLNEQELKIFYLLMKKQYLLLRKNVKVFTQL